MTEERIEFSEVGQPESSRESALPGQAAESDFESRSEQMQERVGEKYAQILSKVKSAQAPADSSVIMTDVEAVAQLQDAEAVVARLVALAETKGVSHAVSVARKMQDLYILDTMHDTLADELYDALQKKGLIETE